MSDQSNRNNRNMPQPVKVEVSSEHFEDVKPEEVVEAKPIQVVAILKGTYGGRRDPGDKFTIAGEHKFSKLWMKKI